MTTEPNHPAPLRVLEIDLCHRLPTINLQPNGQPYNGALLVGVIHGLPIGTLELTPTDQPTIQPPAVAAAFWHEHHLAINACLAELGAPPVANLTENGLSVPNPTISRPPAVPITVAICTKDRPADIASCLTHIQRLTYPTFDILVIDNNPSTSATADLIARDFPTARYLRETRGGISAARNRAIAEAHSDWVAFIDDDVHVSPNWLWGIATGIASAPNVGLITGPIFPAELETPAQYYFEALNGGGFNRGFQSQRWDTRENRPARPFFFPYLPGIFGTGANAAMRVSAVRQLGGFSLRLAAGSPVPAGEDLDIFFRLVTANWQVVYQPGAFVYHRHRRDLPGLKRQTDNYDAAFGALLAKWIIEKPWRAIDLLLRLPYIPYVLLLKPDPDRQLRQAKRNQYPSTLRQHKYWHMLRGVGLWLKSLTISLPPAAPTGKPTP